MKKILKIFGTSLIWFLVWAIFIFYLEPQGIGYINRYILTSIYFLLIIIILTSFFKKEVDGYVDDFSVKDLLHMVLYSIAVTAIYYFVSIFREGSYLNYIKDNLPVILQLDERFLVTKAFEIMFQQTFFIISIYHFFDHSAFKYKNMFLFGLYAMFIHLPILFIPGHMGKVFFSVSFFSGLIFYYFITKSKKGFLYSYMVHFGFYVLLAMIFWLGGARYLMGLL